MMFFPRFSIMSDARLVVPTIGEPEDTSSKSYAAPAGGVVLRKEVKLQHLRDDLFVVSDIDDSHHSVFPFSNAAIWMQLITCGRRFVLTYPAPEHAGSLRIEIMDPTGGEADDHVPS